MNLVNDEIYVDPVKTHKQERVVTEYERTYSYRPATYTASFGKVIKYNIIARMYCRR